MIRLLLERRSQFALFGGVRFGGTITAEDAFATGFDHIALAIGAGRPTVLDMPNGLARGVRTASDFLMALQLTGAAKTDSIANMQLRLPVVVIGGGLTAVDAATEFLAYTRCRSRNSCCATSSWRVNMARLRRALHGILKSAKPPMNSLSMRGRFVPNVLPRQKKAANRVCCSCCSPGVVRPSPIASGWSTARRTR